MQLSIIVLNVVTKDHILFTIQLRVGNFPSRSHNIIIPTFCLYSINPIISLLVLQFTSRFVSIAILASKCQIDPAPATTNIHFTTIRMGLTRILLGNAMQVFHLTNILHNNHTAIRHSDGIPISHPIGL